METCSRKDRSTVFGNDRNDGSDRSDHIETSLRIATFLSPGENMFCNGSLITQECVQGCIIYTSILGVL